MCKGGLYIKNPRKTKYTLTLITGVLGSGLLSDDTTELRTTDAEA